MALTRGPAPLLPVAEARARICAAMRVLPKETVGIAHAIGRVLATDVVARVTQPPLAVSAMDGYAVRAADVARVPTTLTQVGEVQAGAIYQGAIAAGETVRIFTGAPLPTGADAIVIQEDTTAEGTRITVNESAAQGRYVRPAGLDFTVGTVGIEAGKRLSPRDIGLAAAMNVPWLEVRRRPRVALLATGDEIVRPGEPVGPGQIVSSNALAMAAVLSENGADPIDLGIALDNRESLAQMAQGVRGADLLITMGGASVGEHDLVRAVLGERGLAIDFWQIAMRPGKPLMFGTLDGIPMIGVPGNPVSSLVCALVFVVPAIRALLGLAAAAAPDTIGARLGAALPANDRREDYLRATLDPGDNGIWVATPFATQDSSMLSTLAAATGLIVRPPLAPAAAAGDRVAVIPLPGTASPAI
ncbi:MAG: molybdopterin molybdotransferase MoeA [Alphaproteobacteria bacterium]|nr:molybdopterin molybdotransferase MoeA [Alphaproteobacteria bacterium]